MHYPTIIFAESMIDAVRLGVQGEVRPPTVS